MFIVAAASRELFGVIMYTQLEDAISFCAQNLIVGLLNRNLVLEDCLFNLEVAHLGCLKLITLLRWLFNQRNLLLSDILYPFEAFVDILGHKDVKTGLEVL